MASAPEFASLQAGYGALGMQNASMDVYIYRAAGTFGPYDECLVRRYISEGQLSIDDLAWREGMSEWVSLRELLTQAISPPLSIEPSVLPSSASQLTISSKISKSDESPISPNAPKKGGFGFFLNRLLGKRDFAKYEEVPTVFYRLANGKEYGPATLDRALTFFRSNEARECTVALPMTKAGALPPTFSTYGSAYPPAGRLGADWKKLRFVVKLEFLKARLESFSMQHPTKSPHPRGYLHAWNNMGSSTNPTSRQERPAR